MPYDRNNVFARILRGELPCTKVYEDEHVLAFRDIRERRTLHREGREGYAKDAKAALSARSAQSSP